MSELWSSDVEEKVSYLLIVSLISLRRCLLFRSKTVVWRWMFISWRESLVSVRVLRILRARWFRIIALISSESSILSRPFSKTFFFLCELFERQHEYNEYLSFCISPKSSVVKRLRLRWISVSVSGFCCRVLYLKKVRSKLKWSILVCELPIARTMRKLKKSRSPEISPKSDGKLVTCLPSL